MFFFPFSPFWLQARPGKLSPQASLPDLRLESGFWVGLQYMCTQEGPSFNAEIWPFVPSFKGDITSQKWFDGGKGMEVLSLSTLIWRLSHVLTFSLELLWSSQDSLSGTWPRGQELCGYWLWYNSELDRADGQLIKESIIYRTFKT